MGYRDKLEIIFEEINWVELEPKVVGLIHSGVKFGDIAKLVGVNGITLFHLVKSKHPELVNLINVSSKPVVRPKKHSLQIDKTGAQVVAPESGWTPEARAAAAERKRQFWINVGGYDNWIMSFPTVKQDEIRRAMKASKHGE